MYYVLDEAKNVVLGTFEQWLELYKNNQDNRRVKLDLIGEDVVSTVFLGLEHGEDEQGRPILFETMIFSQGDTGSEIDCWRWATWDEALDGHAKACEAHRQAITKRLT